MAACRELVRDRGVASAQMEQTQGRYGSAAAHTTVSFRQLRPEASLALGPHCCGVSREVHWSTIPGGSAEAARFDSLLSRPRPGYSTVTDLARLRGWSTSVPFSTAVW